MASVSVVGQQPGPQFFGQLGGRKKTILPRKKSWEMFRRSSGSGEEDVSVTAGGDTGTVVRGGMMPGEGCGAPSAHSAPRSPEKQRDSGAGTAAGARQSHSGHITGDCSSNSYMDCHAKHTARGGRRSSSLKGPGTNVMPSESSGHKRVHRHRSATPADSVNGDGGRQSISLRHSAPGKSGGLPLERVTQGRTGVVKLARPEPHRMEAWSIFSQGTDPRVKTERGEGHRFEAKPVKQDWCDACSRQVTVEALKCQNCSYTCHLECKSKVQIDCNKRDREPEEAPSPRRHSSSTASQCRQNAAKEEEKGATKDLSEEEVRARIDKYNAQVTENGMKLASDGSYTGFIKVHLRLNRPVTVHGVDPSASEGASKQAGDRLQAPSKEQEATDSEHSEKRTSFYLPSDSVKQLHISSQTTTGEVIKGLLKKFMVLDDPRKFALYRQTHRDGQDLFQKLPLSDHPLLLRLIAGPDPEQLSFVLKENETGEVEWHAFSVPELQNFLVILQKEEAERIRAVEQKYTVYRKKLQQALEQHAP
ncbi:ras association domain-containing protein 5 isoform X1 [Oreochromis niloticus]|nr:ras association domain-containing protein 5 isoform X1 [Oreochromis niloticus]